MNRKAVWLVFTAAAVLANTGARCSEDLPLSEFIELYASADRTLDAARLRVDAARGTMAAQDYLPTPGLEFNLRAPYRSWGRTYRYEAFQDNTYLGYYEYREESYRMQLALNQGLPTGGRLSVTGIGRQARSDFSVGGFPPEVTIARETGDKEFLMDVGVSLEQPLLGPWEKRDAAHTAKLKYDKQRAQYRLDSAETVKRAINLFFDYMVGLTKVRAERLRLDLAEVDAGTAGARFRDGLVSEIEYLDKRITANDARIAYRKAETSLEGIRRMLRDVGFPLDEGPVCEDLSARVEVDTTGSGPVVSPDALQAEYDLEIARVELANTERKRFGQSTLSMWYGLEGLGESFDESRDLFRENRWGGYLSVRFLFPEPGLGADIESARANLNIARSVFEERRRSVEEKRDIRLGEILALRATADLQSRRNQLLQNVIKVKRRQFEEHLVSEQDVIGAEVDLLQGRVDYLETMRDVNLAWTELILLSGSDPIAVLKGADSPAE